MEENREVKREKVRSIPIEQIEDFPEHPFKIQNDEQMQKLIESIEPFYPFEEEVCFICNDEGKINGMEPNRAIYDDDHNMVDVLFGPGFICSCGGEDFGSLSDEQIERYTEMFKRPEYIFKVNGALQIVPYTPHEAPAQETPTQEAAGEAR